MERVTFGWILAATLDLIRKHLPAIALFSFSLGALAAGLDFFAAGPSLRTGEMIGGFVAGYFLLLHLIEREGLLIASRKKVRLLPYFGVLILSSIGAIFGFLLLVVPGLILIARWSIAYSLVISDGLPVIAAMRESWDRTRNSQWSIVGLYAAFFFVVVVVVVVLMVLAGTIGGIEGAGDFDTTVMAQSGLAGFAGSFAINSFMQGLTGVGYCVAVAIQKGLRNPDNETRMIFE
jgi:hypothetical protein